MSAIFEPTMKTLTNETEVLVRGESVLVDDLSENRRRLIRIEGNSRLTYVSRVPDGLTQEISFELVGSGAELTLRSFAFSKSGKTAMDIVSHVGASGTRVDMETFALVADAGNLSVFGTLDIGPGLREVSGRVHGKNVFLGETGRIRGIPALKVASDDVSATHSCTVERLSEEARFYAESRGIPPDEAKKLLLAWHLRSLFRDVPEFGETVINSIFP